MNLALKKLVPLAAALALTASTASATLIAYDGFTTANSSGTGWTGNWSASYTLGGASLDSGNGLLTSGGSSIGGAYYNSNPGGEPTRTIASMPTSGVVWASWLQNSSPSSGQLGQVRFQSGGTQTFVIGQHFDSNTFHIYNPDVDGSATNSGVTISGVQFVTLRINLDTKAIDLWVNPTGLGAGTAPTSSASASISPGGAFNFNTIKITSDTGTYIVDEFRIGTTWTDVSPTAVPEPSTYAMLAGLATLGLAAFRRRSAR